MLDLDQRHINFIKENIWAEIPNVEIYIFGSRTQGNALEYSDVDIALKNEVKIPIETILKLKVKFENSTFPYKVDIVDLKNLKDKFRGIIEKDLYRI